MRQRFLTRQIHRAIAIVMSGALLVLPGGADLDLRAVQVCSGAEDEGPDPRPEIEHHVLGPGVLGVVRVQGHDEGVSYPSWGLPRYGNDDW